MNILFLSAGRRVELLRLFRSALDRVPGGGLVHAADIDPLAPALQVADRSHRVPRLKDPAFPEALIHLCQRERIDLVFPLIDPDIPVLARLKSALAAVGTQAWVVDEPAALVCRDKRLTRELFRETGLSVPREWGAAEEPEPADYPLFVKPATGSAGQMGFRVQTPAELAFFRGYVPEAVVQECLPGPEITADVVCDGEGCLLGLSLRKRIEVRGGEVLKGETLRDAEIEEACIRIAAALPAKGPITVQCILRDGRPHFTEINARMGGGVPLSVAAGMDAPALLLARLSGLPAPREICHARPGLRMTRFDQSFFL